jgi:hypothetical protein
VLKFVLKSAAEEVVPFLRRIESSLQDGSGVQEAYTEALGETKVLKHLVGEPVEGLPFTEGLLEGAKRSKLRPLIVFANQVKLRERGGDGLKDALRKAVVTTVTLQAEERRAGERPNRRRNQRLLLIGAAAAASVLIARRLRR